MKTTPTYRAMNKPMLMLGCDPRAAGAGVVMSMTALALSGSLLLSASLMALVVVVGRWIESNRIAARLICHKRWAKAAYDAGKSQPFHVAVERPKPPAAFLVPEVDS